MDWETSERYRKDPGNWKWGVFYYNPEDPRLFPPKRTLLGWTINFGNPKSVLFNIIAIGILIVIVYELKHRH